MTASNREAVERHIPVRALAMWSRNDEMAGQYNMLEAMVNTKKTSDWQRSHLRYSEGLREPKPVPRGTTMVTLAERFFCQAIKLDPGAPAETILLPSERGTIAAEIRSSMNAKPGATISYKARVYFGPRDFFNLRDAGFEQAFPLGFLAKIGLVLMVALKGLASIVKNYGLAIILLAAGVTAALAPFTLISVRSMKRMQELQPRMDQLKKKHADDPKRMNQEVFALFKEHKVSPLSGCLPMLLQLPVFFALWSAISHVVELRGARFLWIKDLSLPDRLAKLPLGLDLNILPILMAAAMFMQTKLSQPKVKSSGPNPFSGPLMSVIFGVMFYQVPAGLVLYWLTNSLTSILWYKLAKV
ncbi:MAG: membrane protein insertase YidC [Candidatus Omnitrophica bacterium]|nr:membrane protein insertase YidC [Candidatus Omnitrophota bacterium]